MPLPDLNQLRTFTVLYERRSLTATAEALHVTQPTVSYTLARLRERFGDVLFRREGNVMVPTPRATALFAPLHEALAQIDAAVSDDDDFAPLHAHGFDDEDIWDIAAITAFFGLSNRMASFAGMMPNPEFYAMGRLPKTKA